MTITLNSLSGKILISFSLEFFPEILYSFVWNIFLYVLILFDFLFVSMKLGETVTYPVLEGMSLCGSIPLQSACAQWLW